MNWLSEADWERHFAKCETVFQTTKRLPDVVHRLTPAPHPFFDGDAIFSSEAWPLISALASLHGDEQVTFLTIDPAPEYYLASVGRCGGFTLPVLSSDRAYRDALYGSTLVGSPGVIGYTAEVVAVFGESLKWGLWCERNVAGLVVASDPSILGQWQLEYGPFLTAEDALHGFLSVNLGPGSCNERTAFERNYGSFG